MLGMLVAPRESWFPDGSGANHWDSSLPRPLTPTALERTKYFSGIFLSFGFCGRYFKRGILNPTLVQSKKGEGGESITLFRNLHTHVVQITERICKETKKMLYIHSAYTLKASRPPGIQFTPFHLAK